MLTLSKVNDLSNIEDITRLLNQLTPTPLNISEEYCDEVIKADNFNYYLLSLDSVNIGIGGLQIRKTLYHNCKSIGYIEDIVIDKDFRRRGYGNFLIQEIVKEARKLNCYKVVLQCNPDKYEFYESCGFVSNTMGCSLYFD